MQTLSLTSLAAALIPSIVAAQVQFDPTIGVGLGVGEDTLVSATLGFPFTFPDGSIVTDIDIDSNGRLFPLGGDTSDFSESIGEFLSGTTSICGFWDDTSPQALGDVFFSTTATQANITFLDTGAFPGGTDPYTVQIQLHSDGRIGVIYNMGLTSGEDGLVGISEGGGAADPGLADLSTALMSAGVTTVYEDFPGGLTDLAGLAIEFAPDGGGGWDTTVTSAEVFGDPCSATLDFGTGLGVGDDTISTVALGFSFTMPDGSVVTDVDIDSNGRIIGVGADSSDFTESVTELLGEGPTIAIFHDDLNTGPNGGDVFFRTDGATAYITWVDTAEVGVGAPFTIQAQLHSNGRICFAYDAAVSAAAEGLVGISEGGGAADPLGSDVSAPLMTAGVTTVYEDFAGGATDIGDISILFEPDGVGGWNTIIGASGFALPPIPGFVADAGQSANRAFIYTPDMAGGYSIDRAIGTFIDDSGSSIDLNALAVGSGDDELYTVTIGFPFTFPGGATVTDIVIDTNGRILADATDGSDFSASISEALTGAPGAVVPFWCDMTPPGGTFTFSTTATDAIITMLDAPQFAESNTISWQCTLHSDSSFTINYINTHTWRTGFGSTSDDVIAGCFSGTSGAGTDPGEGDHSLSANLSNAEGTFYEFWDASFSENAAMQPVLDVVGIPTLGGTMDLALTGISDTATLTTLFFGFANPGDLPLDGIGIEGGTISSSIDATFDLVVAGEDATFSLPLPLNPGFVGLLDMHLQAMYVSIGDTTLSAVVSNGVNVFF